MILAPLIKGIFAAGSVSFGALIAAASSGGHIHFEDTITLGAALIVGAVSIATLVGVIRGVKWKSEAQRVEFERNAEEKRGDRIQRDFDELSEHYEAQLEKHEQYREVKHEQAATREAHIKRIEGELEAERRKHDYSAVVSQVALLAEELASRTPIFESLVGGQQQMVVALDRVVGALDILLARNGNGPDH